MFSKYKLNQVPIWGAYYDPIKQIDSIPIMDEEEITNVDMRLTWDSENRLKQVSNNSHDARYLYDSSGQRVLKRGNRTEIVYPTQFIQLDRAKKLYTKHIFLGTTRISSKLCSITNYFKDIEFEKRNNYTYHPDHLGSTSFVSDFRGEVYEYYQYTPYGEIWAEKSDILDKITHLFTSKELDAESGFYYFGARYLEPMTSRWISCDPILDGYLPTGNKNEKLPGMCGVFNPVNLSLYHYSLNNPLKYTDPTGLAGEWIENVKQSQKDLNTIKNTNCNISKQFNSSNGAAEIIAKALLRFPGLIISIFEMKNSKEISQAQQKMWQKYYKAFNARLDSIAKENGSISARDLMGAVLETNEEMSKVYPLKVSIFKIRGRIVDATSASEVMLLLCFSKSFFRGYKIDFDFQSYANLISNTSFMIPKTRPYIKSTRRKS